MGNHSQECFVRVLSSPDMLIVFNFSRCHQRRYVDVLVVHVVVHVVVVVVVVVVHVADVSLEVADKSHCAQMIILNNSINIYIYIYI